MCKMQDAEGKGIRKYMEPYIFVHMMTSVDGRIDCPMVGQLSTDEYYIALEKLGLCSDVQMNIP